MLVLRLPLRPTPIVAPMPLDRHRAPTYYATGIGELYARSGWDTGATWVNLIAGPYTESHAHQDQGSIMIYKGGWLAYDANVQSKSRPRRRRPRRTASCGSTSGGAPVQQIASTMSTLAALHQGAGYALRVGGPDAGVQRQRRGPEGPARAACTSQPNVVVVYDRVADRGRHDADLAARDAGRAVDQRRDRDDLERGPHAARDADRADRGGDVGVRLSRRPGLRRAATASTRRLAGGDSRYLHVLAVDGAVVVGIGERRHGCHPEPRRWWHGRRQLHARHGGSNAHPQRRDDSARRRRGNAAGVAARPRRPC